MLNEENDGRMLKEIIATLTAAGVKVPPNCDKETAARLVTESLTRPARDLSGIDGQKTKLRALLDEYASATSKRVAPGSRAWEAATNLSDLRAEIARTEARLVDALKEAYYGYVHVSSLVSARPHGEDLLALVESLRRREADGELPRPGVFSS
jgi:hypothetical protein